MNFGGQRGIFWLPVEIVIILSLTGNIKLFLDSNIIFTQSAKVLIPLKLDYLKV